MSQKHSLKKDGSDKNLENQGRREAERNPELKHELSEGKPKNQFPPGEAKETDHKHKV